VLLDRRGARFNGPRGDEVQLMHFVVAVWGREHV
jgi:hypothetical protein